MIKIFIRKRIFSLLIIILLLSACNRCKDKASNLKKDIFTIKTIQIDSSGWGYDVYKNGNLIIHQPNIPAIEGDKCFKSKEEAYKVGELVIEKLNKNIFPPSITKEEVEKSMNK